MASVGLGLAALGRPAYITLARAGDLGDDRSVETMERRTHAMLDAAYAAGIRYIDSARSYGRAEEFLAHWLRRAGLERDDIVVGSKWGYRYVGDWSMDAPVHEVKDHSLRALEEQWRQSERLLGRWLALYQVHSATLESGVLEDGAVLGELCRLRDDGVAVGLTVSGPSQAEVIARALRLEPAGNPFTSVQATWNLLEPSAAPALLDAHERGWQVIVKESLANGRLAGAATGEILRRIAGRHVATVDQLALAAALAQPWADVVLSGAVTPAQLASNVAARDLCLDGDELEELAALAEPAPGYWQARSRLPWS